MDIAISQSAELVSDPQACHAMKALEAKQTLNQTSGSAGRQQQLNQLLESEWMGLPYAMMQFTAAGVPAASERFYWRDHKVHLGEMKLQLTRIPEGNNDAGYTATYSVEEVSRVFQLCPTLEGNALRWSILGICGARNLTSAQLGRKLLDKLVTFYRSGIRELAAGVRTDSTLPSPSYDVMPRSRPAIKRLTS